METIDSVRILWALSTCCADAFHQGDLKNFPAIKIRIKISKCAAGLAIQNSSILLVDVFTSLVYPKAHSIDCNLKGKRFSDIY